MVLVVVTVAELPHRWRNLSIDQSCALESTRTGASCFTSLRVCLLNPPSKPFQFAITVELIVRERNSSDGIEHSRRKRALWDSFDSVFVQRQHVQIWQTSERVFDQTTDSISSEHEKLQLWQGESVRRNASDAVGAEIKEDQFFEIVKFGEGFDLVVFEEKFFGVGGNHFELD